MIFVVNNSQIIFVLGDNQPADLIELIMSGSPIAKHLDVNSSKKSVLNLKSGLMNFVSRPISSSLRDKPISETLIFASYLDESEAKTLSEVVHLPIDII